MKKMLGLIAFCIAVGMLLMLLLWNRLLGLIMIGLFLLVGYNFYCDP